MVGAVLSLMHCAEASTTGPKTDLWIDRPSDGGLQERSPDKLSNKA